MAEQKNDFRRHVRAAKEWLGETEASLEKAEDIKGDLSFMLAQAELERAKETKQAHRAALRQQGLALLAAMLLAGGGWLLWQWQNARQTVPEPAVGTATENVIQPAPKPAAQTVLPTPERTPAPAEVPEAEQPGAGTEAQHLPQPELQQEAVTPAAPEVGLPEEELQHLMSEAGRTLRAP